MRCRCLKGTLALAATLWTARLPAEPPPTQPPPNPRDDRAAVHQTLTLGKRSITSSLNQLAGRSGASGSGFITLQQPVLDVASFGMSGLIPDGGTLLAGGMKSQGEGRNQFGPGLRPNTATGRSGSTTQATVKVRIIDFKEEEERLLGNGGRGGSGR